MIIYAVRDADHEMEVRRRHSFGESDTSFVMEGPGFVSRMRAAISLARTSDLVCIVHGDVTLPAAFSEYTVELRSELDRNWPNWGAVGNAGVTPLGFGLRSRRRIRYFFDNEFGPNLSGHIVPAENLLENVIVLETTLAQRVFEALPEIENRDLFALALSVEVLRSGRALLLAPHLACHRNDRIPPDPSFVLRCGDGLASWIAQRISNVSVETYRGRVDLNGISDSFRGSDRIDVTLQSLRNAQSGREPQSVAIVTRTRFERPAFLERSVLTTSMFIAAARHASFEHCVISNPAAVPPASLPRSVKRVTSTRIHETDDRFHLVREAASNLRSRYLWFVDDDDWLFPNAAETISLMVSLAPPGSSLFVDVMHFAESDIETLQSGPPISSVHPIRRFPATHFAASLTGQNFTPFCGVILDRESIAELPPEIFDRITFFEDYTLILASLVSRGSLPVTASVLAAGISMRGGDHSATQPDRRPWNASLAELSHFMTRSPESAPLLSIGDLMNPAVVDPDVPGNWMAAGSARSSKLVSGLRWSKQRLQRTAIWHFLRRFRLLRRFVAALRGRIVRSGGQ